MTNELDRIVAEHEAAEGRAVAAFLQGALFQTCAMARVDGSLNLKIAGVEQTTDDNGNYVDHFTVVTEAGHRLRVKVSPE